MISSALPFLVVLGIGGFHLADQRAKKRSINPPVLLVVDPNQGDRSLFPHAVDWDDEQRFVIPMRILNEELLPATNVVLELEYPYRARSLLSAYVDAPAKGDGNGFVVKHTYPKILVQKTLFTEFIDSSVLLEDGGDPMEIAYRISCDEVDSVFEGTLTAYFNVVLQVPRMKWSRDGARAAITAVRLCRTASGFPPVNLH